MPPVVGILAFTAAFLGFVFGATLIYEKEEILGAVLLIVAVTLVVLPVIWRYGYMINRLGTYLASRPRRAAVIVLTLAVAFILVLAGLVLELSHFGQAPYPSQELGFSLVNGNVLFTSGGSMGWYNSTSNTTEEIQSYTGAMMAFGVLSSGWGTGFFGDEPQLSANTGSPSTVEWEVYNESPNVIMELTDLTSNGVFDEGDTILFKIVPLQEDTVFFLGLVFVYDGDRHSSTEMSFAIHDGKLYSWYSDNLPDRGPWWEPFWN